MLLWLRFIGPGLALFFGGVAIAAVPRLENLGVAMFMAGVAYLFIVGPMYRRRWRAQRKAKDWHLLREAKKKYQ